MAILKTTIVAALTAATLASGAVAVSTPAAARGGWGGPFAGGLIGGLAAGALIGAASRPYGYGGGYAYGGGYGYGYAPYPAYGVDPVPVYNPCYRGRSPVYDGYGTFVGYRPVRVCN